MTLPTPAALPVLVTGATGRVGRLVVDALRAAGAPVRALTRRSASAGLPADVDLVAGDLTAPESLDAALHGVGAVFLVWTAPPDTVSAVASRLAATGARGRRVVLLSSPHRTPHPFFSQPNPMAALHAAVERALADAALPTTVIRPGMFASNVLAWWGAAIRAGDVVRWPYGAAETAPIDERDIAAVAARALLDDAHAGREYLLTGPEPLTHVDQVRAIGEAIGRPLRFEELTPDEFRRDTAGRWPPAAVEMLLAAWRATLGHPALVTSTVAEVLGAPARSFRAWAADHADAFRESADAASR
jgi:uncharacterized protein YbjT (DUF2867 family)